MSERRVHGFMYDEQGDLSAARLLLTVALGFSFGFIVAVTIWDREVTDSIWHFLEAVDLSLASWAGVPRVARYLRKPKEPSADV